MQNYSDSNSRFSWHRVAEIAAFYSPTTNRLLLVYVLSSLLFAVLTILPLREYAQVGLFSIIWTVIPLMFELAPIALAKHGDSRIVERLLPATPAEKFTYYLIFFTLAVGAAIFVLPTLALLLYNAVPSVQTPMMLKLIDIKFNNPPMVDLSNVMSLLAASYTCLLVVNVARSGRVVKGVIAVFVVQIAIGMMGAVAGFSAAFSQGCADGVKGTPTPDPSEISRTVVDSMLQGPYIYIMTLLVIAYTVTVLCLLYRNLNKGKL